MGLYGWLDAVSYRLQRVKHRNANRAFRTANPGLAIPPDYSLYETYRLDYRMFIHDGRLAAQEIQEWSLPYLDTPARILDWGCGTGRITRHLPGIFPGTEIYGCDSNTALINWDQSNYQHIRFTVTDHTPPTGYAVSSFDLIYGFSVLTHIDAELQPSWLEELCRIMKKEGILMITTHGNRYLNQLIPSEKRILLRDGMYTRRFRQQGHRMVTTYHDPVRFRQLLEMYFIVLEHHDGEQAPGRIGGQDLWIVKKQA